VSLRELENGRRKRNLHGARRSIAKHAWDSASAAISPLSPSRIQAERKAFLPLFHPSAMTSAHSASLTATDCVSLQ
jgi:hypothetical protein